MKTIIIFLLLITFSLDCLGQKIELALHLKIGDTYFTNSTINSTIDQKQNGQQVSFNAFIVVKTSFKVIKIIDTIYEMEVKYKKLSLKVKTVKGEANYSSVNAAKNDATSQLLAALINKPFFIKLSTAGRIISVDNIDQIADNVIAKTGGSDQDQKEQLKAQVMKFFGEQSFKERLQETLAIYPSIKVSKSDSWMTGSRIESLGELQVTTTYQLANMAGSYYTIHGHSNISMDKNKITQVKGIPVSYDISGAINSDTKVDKKTGWIIEAKLQQLASGSYKIQDNPKFPVGLTVPINLNTKVFTNN